MIRSVMPSVSRCGSNGLLDVALIFTVLLVASLMPSRYVVQFVRLVGDVACR